MKTNDQILESISMVSDRAQFCVDRDYRIFKHSNFIGVGIITLAEQAASVYDDTDSLEVEWFKAIYYMLYKQKDQVQDNHSVALYDDGMYVQNLTINFDCIHQDDREAFLNGMVVHYKGNMGVRKL